MNMCERENAIGTICKTSQKCTCKILIFCLLESRSIPFGLFDLVS